MTQPPKNTVPPHEMGQQQDVEQHTLDSASAALDAGDPEALHSTGRGFTATADRLRGLSDEFRKRLSEVESAWQGPGSRAFADTAARIAHRVDELVSTLTEPSYDWLCREMGNALANGQREVRQLRSEQHDRPAHSAAPQENPGQQENRSSPQDGRAQQVMNELANTYRQLGDQLRPLAKDGPAPPEPPQLPNSGTGPAHLDGAPAGANDPQMGGLGDPAQSGGAVAALPAGGVLGKLPKADLPQEAPTAENADAPRGALGRPASGPVPPAAPMHAAVALTGAAIGRSESSGRKSRAPTERMEAEESEQPGVLGGDKRPAPQSRRERAQGSDDLPADASSEGSAHDEQEAAEPASAPAPASPPPATTSSPPPGPIPAQEVAPAAPQLAPAPAVAHAEPNVAQAHPQVAQAHPQVAQAHPQVAQAQAAAAASPAPHGAGGVDTGVSLANTGPPTPPQPVQTPDPPPAHQPPDAAQENQGSGGGQGAGGGMPPPGGGLGGSGAGAGGADAAAGGERNRNTWLTESNDRWENTNPSGVLGR